MESSPARQDGVMDVLEAKPSYNRTLSGRSGGYIRSIHEAETSGRHAVRPGLRGEGRARIGWHCSIQDVAPLGSVILLAGAGYFSSQQITFNNGEVVKFTYNFEGTGTLETHES